MKVTLTVLNKLNHENELILFDVRCNWISANFGNNVNIEIKDVEADEEYKLCIGDFGKQWTRVCAFMMDCVKHDLICTSINGQPLKDENGEVIDELNTYNQPYKIMLGAGEHKIEIGYKTNKKFEKKRLLIS